MEDLKIIKGIGPAHAEALGKLGIATIAALAAITEPDKFVDAALFRAEDLAGWIEEAQKRVEDSASEEQGEPPAQTDAAGEEGKRPATRKRRAKSKKPSGPRRSVVLLVDDKQHGSRGTIVSIEADAADGLRAEGKARRATLDDFRTAGKLQRAGG
ncbi:MAG TPA: hypothetical protein VNS12_14760 [Pelagibacterium sp.]|uniref:hypothetical protein n=1 Tax=Pelagibacterium sp. TaxID=1967288 RepID=UPI002BB524A7|nr:hypothetical protein [Pelagibacterium sp.]HWJ89325.1 hypothetical protein [Pelagibacterium sp.]